MEKQIILILTAHIRSYSKVIYFADNCTLEQSNAENNHILYGKSRPWTVWFKISFGKGK